MTPRWQVEAEQRKARQRETSRVCRARRTSAAIQDLALEAAGHCMICEKQFAGPRLIHLDHCHETGRYRGLLCPSCNTAIGKLGDSVDGLMRAVRYLQNS